MSDIGPLQRRDTRIDELEAEIERLRAALAECVPFNRDACIEECARVAETQAEWNFEKELCDRIAAAIRALKDRA